MSPTGRNETRRFCRADSGFTLIEVMIVIVIIGLMSSLVLLNMPASEKTAREQAEELAARLALAARSAVLSGETVGVTMTSDGYGFLRRRATGWEQYSLIPEKPWMDWVDHSQVRLTLEGEAVKLPSRKADATPILYFTTTGDSPAFSITLFSGGTHAIVSTDRTGAIMVSDKDVRS